MFDTVFDVLKYTQLKKELWCLILWFTFQSILKLSFFNFNSIFFFFIVRILQWCILRRIWFCFKVVLMRDTSILPTFYLKNWRSKPSARFCNYLLVLHKFCHAIKCFTCNIQLNSVVYKSSSKNPRCGWNFFLLS